MSVESLARELAVSRAEVLRQCGAIKSEQELEEERKLRQLEKFEEKVQEAGVVKRESELEKRIKEAEQRVEELSDYEKVRLENMKERQALLEQLDMDKEWKEIAEEKQKSMVFTPSDQVQRRAPSARLKILEERNSLVKESKPRDVIRRPRDNKDEDGALQVQSGDLKLIEMSTQNRKLKPKKVLLEEDYLRIQKQIAELPPASQRSEEQKKELNRMRMRLKSIEYKTDVVHLLSKKALRLRAQRGELKLADIPTENKKSEAKTALLEYIAAEVEEVIEEPAYKSMNGTLVQTKLVRESLVAASTITELASCWDFVGFGTEEGEVGVQVGSANNRWQPHAGKVTGVAFDGGASSLSLLSSSLDGGLRKTDLSRQSVVLEHVEEQKSIGCLVKKSPGIFLFSSGSAVKLFDLRMQSAVIVVDLQESGGLSVGSKMTLHPTESHLLAVPLKSRAEIFDMRQSKGALLSLPGTFFSLQWSPDLGKHILITGQPTKRKYAHKSVANRSIQARVHKTSLLMSGVVQPLLSQSLSDPLAAQWSPWTKDTMLLSDPSRSSGKLR